MTIRKDRLDGVAVSLLLACTLFWGVQQVLVKATMAEVPPLFQASLRFAAATLVILCWCRLRGIRLVEPAGTLALGICAGLLFSIEFAGIYLGLQYTTVSRLTIFLYSAPFWVAAVLPLTGRSEQPTRTQWAGLVIAFLGVLLALSDGLTKASPRAWIGDLLGVLAGAAWGLTTVLIRSTRLAQVAPEKLLLWQVAVSTATLPLLSLALGEDWVWHFSAFAATSLAIQTVVGAFASYLAWTWLMVRYPPTKTSSFTFLTPVFAVICGVVFLAEPLSFKLVAALLAVAAGIYLVNRQAYIVPAPPPGLREARCSGSPQGIKHHCRAATGTNRREGRGRRR